MNDSLVAVFLSLVAAVIVLVLWALMGFIRWIF